MTNINLTILKASLITALGDNLSTTAAAYKAGINRYQDSTLISRSQRKPLKVANIPQEALVPLMPGLAEKFMLTGYQQKICRIAITALASLAIPAYSAPVTLLLNASESVAASKINHIIPAISTQMQTAFCPATSAITGNGRAGALLALATAKQLIEAGRASLVIIGGVDSWLSDIRRIEALDQKNRLLIEDSFEGFVPGEAGAFIAVAQNSLTGEQLPVHIASGASEIELGHIDSQQIYKGDALAQACSKTFAATPDAHVQSLYSTLNGENYWAKEIGIALIRNNKFFNAKLTHYHPADSLGDTGAAAGAVLIALAFQHLQSANQHILISASSDAGLRSAVLLQSKR